MPRTARKAKMTPEAIDANRCRDAAYRRNRRTAERAERIEAKNVDRPHWRCTDADFEAMGIR
jgi:hypothetical protein